jgi:DNA (cytosine-5)-methyltransferase 1
MATTTAPRFARVALPDLVAIATKQANETFAEAARRSRVPRAFTYIDLLCGGGGSSVGLFLAGGELLAGINHDKVAIATHSRNFPHADHKVADLDHYDMRNLPPGADVLWASVICTEISPAGGKKRKTRKSPGQLELLEFGPVSEETFERTRATAQDVVRAAELWMFPIICVENVVDFCTDWKLFRWWLSAFEILGYRWQIMVASSAHLGGDGIDQVAQWRDRIYVVFTRLDLPPMDLEPRPAAWCPRCDASVESMKVWKDPRGWLTASGEWFMVGKYGADNGQYVYRCPVRGHGQVEPYVRPALEIIDWSKRGVPIGEREAAGKKPLVPNTLARLQRGIDMAAAGRLSPAFLDANGGSWNTGPASVTAPFRTRTTKEWEGLCSPPPGTFIDTMRRNTLPRSPWEPLTTVAAGGSNHGIVVPYYTTGVASSTAEPLPTVTCVDRFGLATGDDFRDINRWSYRMVSWIESALAQGFPVGYEIAGNQGERMAQVGNAVSCSAAQYLGARIGAVLAGAKAVA